MKHTFGTVGQCVPRQQTFPTNNVHFARSLEWSVEHSWHVHVATWDYRTVNNGSMVPIPICFIIATPPAVCDQLEGSPTNRSHTPAHLFQDDSSWPLHSSRFYLGLLPSLLPPTTSLQSLTTQSQRLLTRLTHSCHTSAIRLAARIWGLVVRDYLSLTRKPGSSRPANRDSLLRASKLSLPPHLQFLLHL